MSGPFIGCNNISDANLDAPKGYSGFYCATLEVVLNKMEHLVSGHSLFSAFILLLSSRPTLSLCSVYSCLMSSLAASIFRGFLDDWTLRAGRTARLCCSISEVSLGERSEGNAQ